MCREYTVTALTLYLNIIASLHAATHCCKLPPVTFVQMLLAPIRANNKKLLCYRWKQLILILLKMQKIHAWTTFPPQSKSFTKFCLCVSACIAVLHGCATLYIMKVPDHFIGSILVNSSYFDIKQRVTWELPFPVDINSYLNMLFLREHKMVYCARHQDWRALTWYYISPLCSVEHSCNFACVTFVKTQHSVPCNGEKLWYQLIAVRYTAQIHSGVTHVVECSTRSFCTQTCEIYFHNKCTHEIMQVV